MTASPEAGAAVLGRSVWGPRARGSASALPTQDGRSGRAPRAAPRAGSAAPSVGPARVHSRVFFLLSFSLFFHFPRNVDKGWLLLKLQTCPPRWEKSSSEGGPCRLLALPLLSPLLLLTHDPLPDVSLPSRPSSGLAFRPPPPFQQGQ